MKKSDLSQLLFIISYALIMAADMLSNFDFFKPFLDHMSHLGVIIMIFLILIQSKKYNIKTLLLSVLLFTLFACICFELIDKNLVYFFLLILSFKNIDFDTFVRRVFCIRLGLTLFIVLGHYLGLTTDLVMYRNDGFIRNSMGFAHPNRFASCIFELVLEYFYIRRKNIVLFDYILLFMSGLLIYFLVDSRSTIIVLGLFFIMLIIYKNQGIYNNKIVTKITNLSPFIMLALSFLIINMYMDGNSYIIELNKLLTGRIELMTNAYNDGGISLFGVDYIYNVDNAYIQLLLKFGVIYLILYLYGYHYIIKKVLDKKMIMLTVIFVVYCVYGLTEAYMCRVTYNVFNILFGYLLYTDKEVIE